MDLAESSAEFLIVHGTHNLWIAIITGLVLILLSLYALLSARRNARLVVEQRHMQHLATMGEMAAVLAHEIRNPLGAIKGFAQLAAEKSDANLRSLLEPILSETSRLEALVRDLLLYGRPPSPDFQLLHTKAAADSVLAFSLQIIANKEIEFSVSCEDSDFTSDPALLDHALHNLLRNAFEAVEGRPGARVSLAARRVDGGGVEIVVADNGPGIPARILSNLYEPFQTTKAQGTGLGLSIARKMVQSLHGSLSVSLSPDGGTTAVITIPGEARNGKSLLESGEVT